MTITGDNLKFFEKAKEQLIERQMEIPKSETEILLWGTIFELQEEVVKIRDYVRMDE